jgi:hypothetical protein
MDTTDAGTDSQIKRGTLPALLKPVNDLLKPLIKAGFANPVLFSPGITVLEVPGRKSGKQFFVPLSCYLAGPLLIIGTVRPDSQWIKNLAAADAAFVWLWGKRWSVNKLSVTNHAATLSLRARG